MSKFDSLYRKFLLTKFFTKGWGKPEHMRRIMALRRTIAADRNAALGCNSPLMSLIMLRVLRPIALGCFLGWGPRPMCIYEIILGWGWRGKYFNKCFNCNHYCF